MSFLKYWNRGPERCGSPSLGLSRFDYKRPSAAWSCFEVSSAGSCTRWPPEVPFNLNYSIILRKWGLCFMNRHCMVQQTNTTKAWKVGGFFVVVVVFKLRISFPLPRFGYKISLATAECVFWQGRGGAKALFQHSVGAWTISRCSVKRQISEP